MTYKEFIDWCEDNGYDVTDTEEEIFVSEEPLFLCSVSKKYRNSMDTTSFRSLPEHLFHKVMELAMTPLREREDPKRYIVKMPTGDDEGFYALDKYGSFEYMLGAYDADLGGDRFRLTEEGIKEIDGRYMAFAVEVEQ